MNRVSSGATWKVGIQEQNGAWQYWDLNTGSTAIGTFQYDIAAVTGWSGQHSFCVQLVVEGTGGSFIEVDRIRICRPGSVYGSANQGQSLWSKLISVPSSPTYTPTPTWSPTISPTPTLTVVSTQTATPTQSPTLTLTPWMQENKVMAFPNPARGRVTFAYTLSGPVRIKIDIYRLTGERVATIAEHQNGGTGQTLTSIWEAAQVAPGIYFCRIVATDAGGKEVLNVKKKIALVR